MVLSQFFDFLIYISSDVWGCFFHSLVWCYMWLYCVCVIKFEVESGFFFSFFDDV